MITNNPIKIVHVAYLENQNIFSDSFGNVQLKRKTSLSFKKILYQTNQAKAISKYFYTFVVVNKLSVYFLFKYQFTFCCKLQVRTLNYFIFRHNLT